MGKITGFISPEILALNNSICETIKESRNNPRIEIEMENLLFCAVPGFRTYHDFIQHTQTVLLQY